MAQASVATKPWPPASGPGQLFVHYGEEHFNDDDGPTLFPKVVQESGRYRPSLVTTSGDKDNDGTVEQLTSWKEIMSAYDRVGVPYLGGVGNHDRKSPPGVPPGTAGLITPGVQGSLENYKQIFADRPFPFGDAPNYKGIGPARPAGEPAGASSHYYADIGEVRWIFLDNSCWGLTDCDSVQSPAFPDGQGNTGQLQFLERYAAEGRGQGKTVFVVMHMPTRDPRDQSYIDPLTFTHVMGKNNPAATGTPDNQRFEAAAERSGVDGVFLGHIKGQFVYRGRGNVPYYVDGGAGGELYTEGPVGTDHGYWHGFRMLRVAGGQVTTDTVPIFVPEGIRIQGARSVRPGKGVRFEAFGRQPVFNDPAKVEALELRDPDPVRPVSDSGMGAWGDFMRGGGWAFSPILLLLLGGVMLTTRLSRQRRRLVAVACATAGAAVIGTTGMSLAQQSAPTTTPLESLPNPARVFATSDPQVLAPVASRTDDPRRNERTQTTDGLFRAGCPGAARIRVTSGFETSARPVSVPSRRGQKIASRVRALGVRALRPPKPQTVARVRLRQPARVAVLIRRNGRTVRELRSSCVTRAGAVTTRWDGRLRRRGKLRPARTGRYRVLVTVRSDRRPLRRSAVVRVVPKRR
ncbi:MAG: metallophosphoesterase [Thermoleophilaceae bacterium]|nr:metallophosphoesterase [Thermoleophilaceae bacterium]